MKEQLAKELFKLIDFTKDGVIKGIALMQEQTPDLIREIVAYNRCYLTTIIILSCIIVIPLIIVLKNGDYDNLDSFMPRIMISILAGIPPMLCIVRHFELLSKVWFAPKLFLVDYILGVVK